MTRSCSWVLLTWRAAADLVRGRCIALFPAASKLGRVQSYLSTAVCHIHGHYVSSIKLEDTWHNVDRNSSRKFHICSIVVCLVLFLSHLDPCSSWKHTLLFGKTMCAHPLLFYAFIHTHELSFISIHTNELSSKHSRKFCGKKTRALCLRRSLHVFLLKIFLKSKIVRLNLNVTNREIRQKEIPYLSLSSSLSSALSFENLRVRVRVSVCGKEFARALIHTHTHADA